MMRMTRMTVEGFNRRALYELRTEAELTQEDLALMLGIDATSISRWENGRSAPHPQHLAQLAEILEVEQSDLLDPVNPLRALQEYRRRAGLSQTEAARTTGLAVAAIQSLERGVRLPSEHESAQIAQAYGITAPEVQNYTQLLRDHRRDHVLQRQRKGKGKRA